MTLYLLRHAIAAPRDAKRYPDDGKRPLTAKGAERMRAAARGIRALGLRPRRIHSSPLLRCMQTAEILAAELRPNPSVIPTPQLGPEGSARAVLKSLHAERPQRDVLLVGHEPDLSELASLLLDGSGRTAFVKMKKAAFCRIDIEGVPDAGRGRLAYLLPPRILRQLARSIPKRRTR
ncbi:MAG TPA: histidine phosphatase family protein [Candidatus Polarisedimenticolia bacterium]|nr:histidine phosphatase family protein [Candidatus Polarisedimenticolia bacterium]